MITVFTLEQARQKITARVEALKATFGAPVVVDYANAERVDTTAQKDAYLHVAIRRMDGQQVGLGVDSLQRVIGTVVLEARCREGTGTAQMNKILEHFYRGLHKTDVMSPVRTYAARFGPGTVKDGWVRESSVIPFWYDSTN